MIHSYEMSVQRINDRRAQLEADAARYQQVRLAKQARAERRAHAQPTRRSLAHHLLVRALGVIKWAPRGDSVGVRSDATGPGHLGI